MNEDMTFHEINAQVSLCQEWVTWDSCLCLPSHVTVISKAGLRNVAVDPWEMCQLHSAPRNGAFLQSEIIVNRPRNWQQTYMYASMRIW